MLTRFLVAISLGFVSVKASYAGVCELTIKRTACAGKEKESYAKCPGGVAQCASKKKAETDAECQKIAEEECSNSRTDVTKSKEITAKFGGQPVKGGANLCAADRPDYNKCK